MNVVWWLFVGLVAGAIARLLVPGRQALGFWGTLLLGLAGSIVGGFIGVAIESGKHGFSPAGFLGSIIGAVVILLIWRAVTRRRRPAA